MNIRSLQQQEGYRRLSFPWPNVLTNYIANPVKVDRFRVPLHSRFAVFLPFTSILLFAELTKNTMNVILMVRFKSECSVNNDLREPPLQGDSRALLWSAANF